MRKRYCVFSRPLAPPRPGQPVSDGPWYIEMQEDTVPYHWVIVAGPFATEDQAWDALDKLRGD